MIKTWKHKGLRLFFETGSTKGIQAKHAKKLRIQLGLLNSAKKAADMGLPGYDFHALKGDMYGVYAITVNGNWRLTFKFEGCNAELVNYEDYH